MMILVRMKLILVGVKIFLALITGVMMAVKRRKKIHQIRKSLRVHKSQILNLNIIQFLKYINQVCPAFLMLVQEDIMTQVEDSGGICLAKAFLSGIIKKEKLKNMTKAGLMELMKEALILRLVNKDHLLNPEEELQKFLPKM